MTKKQLERVVSDWQRNLGLDRWEIKVQWDKPCDPKEAFAETTWHDKYDTARISFASDYQAWTVPFGTQTVIHELLHICHRDVCGAWKVASDDLHPAAATHANARYDQALEGFVDRLAYRLLELSA